MNKEPIIFEENDFPVIKLYENHFEVKAIDYHDFRKFEFSNIQQIDFYNPHHTWWAKLCILPSIPFAHKFTASSPWVLKVKQHKGGDWKYKVSYKVNPAFRKMLRLIRSKINKSA